MDSRKKEGKGKAELIMAEDCPKDFGSIESFLPWAVKRRVHALKRLQLQHANIEAKFYEEIHELERKYSALYQPLFEKRRHVVTGEIEPTDEECEWHIEGGEDEDLTEELKKKAMLEEKSQAGPSPSGIPEFWLTIFRNVPMLGDMLQEHDEPILKHLEDITVKFSEPGQPMTFTLEFHFAANSYFSNSVLTKLYKMKADPDASNPLSFEGTEIVDYEGCQIDWQKGKDVTVKTVKKKQKHKGRGTIRTVTKLIPQDSFFNFFNPVKFSSGEEVDEELELSAAADFEVGHFIRERIVPRAVLYFTGEALQDDMSIDEEYEEDDEEAEEEGEEEDEEECDPKGDEPQPAECKQQ